MRNILLHKRQIRKLRTVWTTVYDSAKLFGRIDGTQWAGAFAYSVFMSLFPLILIVVTVTSFFIDYDTAGKAVVTYMKSFAPIDAEMQDRVFGTIDGVIGARNSSGAIALIFLIWTTLQCFTTLIQATNRARGTERFNWWRMPFKSLSILGITLGAIILGMIVPILVSVVQRWLPDGSVLRFWIQLLGNYAFPLILVFFGLCLFYRFAPLQPTRFANVWLAAMSTTILLRAAEILFVVYLKNFAKLNVVYGAFGGVIALLLWIYVSGCILVFGACLSARNVQNALAAKTSSIN